MSEIHWPAGHDPSGADVHVRNETRLPVPREHAWARLVEPRRWGETYRNALRVRHEAGPWPVLEEGSTWSWWTFGAPVRTVAVEVEPAHRLTWTGSGLGAVGCHAFVLEPDGDGCRVVTEETQRGTAVRVLRPVLRPSMRFWHQRWIEGLGR